MTMFKTSSPKSTAFHSGFHQSNLSYKGIPKEYPSGEKIPRAERLRIAKEIMRISKDDASFDVYDGEGNYMKSFNDENEAKRYSLQFTGATYMKRMKDSSLKKQHEEFEHNQQQKEYEQHEIEEGRQVMSQSLSL